MDLQGMLLPFWHHLPWPKMELLTENKLMDKKLSHMSYATLITYLNGIHIITYSGFLTKCFSFTLFKYDTIKRLKLYLKDLIKSRNLRKRT